MEEKVMKWEYAVQFVEEHKLEEGMKEANKKGVLGWELVSVTGTIGLGSTSSGSRISITTGYNFFFKRPSGQS
jgi:hypothetical protein